MMKYGVLAFLVVVAIFTSTAQAEDNSFQERLYVGAVVGAPYVVKSDIADKGFASALTTGLVIGGEASRYFDVQMGYTLLGEFEDVKASSILTSVLAKAPLGDNASFYTKLSWGNTRYLDKEIDKTIDRTQFVPGLGFKVNLVDRFAAGIEADFYHHFAGLSGCPDSEVCMGKLNIMSVTANFYLRF